MKYVTKTFKDFVHHNLNEVTRNSERIDPSIAHEIKLNGKVWVEELIEKYQELLNEYDNLPS